MKIESLSTRYAVRALGINDAPEVLRLYLGNPMYFAHMHSEPSLESVAHDLTALPPGKMAEDKHYLGFYEKDMLVAVMDLIEGFPNAQTAFIGLFMVNSACQGKGIGGAIISEGLHALANMGFAYCRLGYVESNPQSKAFWEKCGFVPTGVRSEQEGYAVVMMQKDLSGTAVSSQHVQAQYATDKNLSTRINFHEKYSVNQKGFGNWLFEQYDLRPGMRILELGCGNASMWRGKEALLPQNCELTLTDFSAGMLEAAKANADKLPHVGFAQVDIMEIPYDRDQFDVVIANMMLYHVPNIDRALSEVRRVLKSEGRFYCATYGEHGLFEYLANLFDDYGIERRLNTRFTLQNGEELLKRRFTSVSRLDYEDRFEVTDENDLLAYMKSMTSMVDDHGIDDAVILTRLRSRKENGRICIPKEYGMFIAER